MYKLWNLCKFAGNVQTMKSVQICRKCTKYEICANLREMNKIWNLCTFAGNVQTMKSVRICIDFIFCTVPASLHVILIVVSIYIWSKSKLLLHLRVGHTRGIWKVLSMVFYLSNRFTNLIMFGIILKSYLFSMLWHNFMRLLWCRHEKYYCEYMYCSYTEKRKISVENITFYLLKSVQNINDSSWT